MGYSAIHTRNYALHLVLCVLIADVVLTRELVHITMRVLRADLVERALVRPFQHRPEALDAVGVYLASHILAGAVPDALMLIGHPLIGAGLGGVDGGVVSHTISDEAVLIGRGVSAGSTAVPQHSKFLNPVGILAPCR